MNVVSWLMGLIGLWLAAFLCLASWSMPSVYASGSDSAPALRKDLVFRVTDQESAQTEAAVFPRRDVAFSFTHRVWARAPEDGNEAASQELAWFRLSQRMNLSGQPERAFQRFTPSPWWADVLMEARVAPFSMLQLSTTAAYDPAAAHLSWATAEFALRPPSFWSFSLAPNFGHGTQLEHLTSRMQLTLPGAWTVSYTLGSPTVGPAAASHTFTTRYHSSYGPMRLQLTQNSEERRIGILIDVTTFLSRALGF